MCTICKHTPYSAVLSNLGKGSQSRMRVRDGYSPFSLIAGYKGVNMASVYKHGEAGV